MKKTNLFGQIVSWMDGNMAAEDLLLCSFSWSSTFSVAELFQIYKIQAITDDFLDKFYIDLLEKNGQILKIVQSRLSFRTLLLLVLADD